jgi:uncharacterized membrane protein
MTAQNTARRSRLRTLGLIGCMLAGCSSAGVASAQTAAPAAASSPVPLARMRSIAALRCVQCHAEHPTLTGSAAAGIQLDTDAALLDNAALIYQQVVVLRAMPSNNATHMSEAERALVGQWFNDGAGSAPAPAPAPAHPAGPSHPAP